MLFFLCFVSKDLFPFYAQTGIVEWSLHSRAVCHLPYIIDDQQKKKEDNRKERFLLASRFLKKYNYFSSYLEQLRRSVSKTKQKSLIDLIVYGQRIEKCRHVNQIN